jgi:nucleoside-diphosphate-sugar epimerase
VAIFGATGGVGRLVARELHARGIAIRVVSRSAENLSRAFGSLDVEIHVADLRSPEAAVRAAEGCDTILHAVGLPYPEFRDHPLLARSTRRAMEQTGARCVLVSSAYSYLPGAPGLLTEDHPRGAWAFKAAMRMEQEDILLGAGAAVLHLPDFYGPEGDVTLANPALRAIQCGRTANWVGGPGVERQLIYLPDAARAIAEIAGRPEAFGERWNLAPRESITAEAFLDIAARMAGTRRRIRAAGLTTLRLLSPFVPIFRELIELYPYYAHPPILSSEKLRSRIPGLPDTSYEEGVAATLRGLRGRP